MNPTRALSPGLVEGKEYWLACRSEPRDNAVTSTALVVGHSHERGELVGIHEEEDHLGTLIFGDLLEGLEHDVLSRHLGEGDGLKPRVHLLG